MSSTTVERIAYGTLCSIFICFLFSVEYFQNKQIEIIKNSAIEIEGKISRKACENHGAFFYSYVVNGKEYSAPRQSCTSIHCEQLQIGDSVKVTYSSTNPSLSVCNKVGSNSPSHGGNYIFPIIASVVFLLKLFSSQK